MSIDDTIGNAVRLLEQEYDQLTARLALVEDVLASLRRLVGDPTPAPAVVARTEANREPVTSPDAQDVPRTDHQRPAGVPRKYDYTDVAQIARDAAQRGVPMSNAIAAHLGIKLTAAKSLLKNVRAAGHAIPAGMPTARARSAATPTSPSDDRHRKVAEIWAAGGSTMATRNRAVAEHFGVSGQSAGQYIRQARLHGFLRAAVVAPVPAAPPAASPVVPPRPSVNADRPMLVCEHCGDKFFSDEALAVHVRRKHANDDAELDAAMDARFPRTEKPDPPVEVATTTDRTPHLLRCDDCPATFEPAELSRLIRHTLAEHRREPRTAERSPRPKDAA